MILRMTSLKRITFHTALNKLNKTGLFEIIQQLEYDNFAKY
jgi:hypothetical protein